jgi:transcription elongation GreA/GreB family factor
VGVDEADPATGRIAHLSPGAAALIGARVGDLVTVAAARAQRQLRVVSVDDYGP